MNNTVLLILIFLLVITSIIFSLSDQRILAQNQSQNSSESVLDPRIYGIVVSIVQIIAGIATAIALVYAALSFKQSRQYNQITMSTDFLKSLISFQVEITMLIAQSKKEGINPQENTELLRSIYQFLSLVEWFSFLVDIEGIKDKRIITLFWPIINSANRWYEIYFSNSYRADINNNMFSNLKKLYSKLKVDESMQRIKMPIDPFDILNELKE